MKDSNQWLLRMFKANALSRLQEIENDADELLHRKTIQQWKDLHTAIELFRLELNKL